MTFGGVGGGPSSVASGTDVALSNPATDDVLTYDGGIAKWKNAAGNADASGVSFTPSGDSALTSTTVQGALTEIDDTKASLSHGHDASEINAGQFSLERLAPGSVVCIDKNKTTFGSAANEWPSARPTSRNDIVIIWKGDTDPGTMALAGDEWKVTA